MVDTPVIECLTEEVESPGRRFGVDIKQLDAALAYLIEQEFADEGPPNAVW